MTSCNENHRLPVKIKLSHSKAFRIRFPEESRRFDSELTMRFPFSEAHRNARCGAERLGKIFIARAGQPRRGCSRRVLGRECRYVRSSCRKGRRKPVVFYEREHPASARALLLARRKTQQALLARYAGHLKGLRSIDFRLEDAAFGRLSRPSAGIRRCQRCGVLFPRPLDHR